MAAPRAICLLCAVAALRERVFSCSWTGYRLEMQANWQPFCSLRYYRSESSRAAPIFAIVDRFRADVLVAKADPSAASATSVCSRFAFDSILLSVCVSQW
jgi:hypothetical protein